MGWKFNVAISFLMIVAAAMQGIIGNFAAMAAAFCAAAGWAIAAMEEKKTSHNPGALCDCKTLGGECCHLGNGCRAVDRIARSNA